MSINYKKIALSIAVSVGISFFITGCGENPSELVEQADKLWQNDSGDDRKNAIKLYKEASNLGSNEAKKFLAYYYFETAQYELAKENIVAIFSTYPVDYNYIYGFMTLYGYANIEKNVTKGIENLINAGDRGIPRAYFELANYYKSISDNKLAIEYYKKALDNDIFEAKRHLSMLVMSNKSPLESKLKAVKYLTQEAKKGDREAQAVLARAYIEGNGVDVNLSKAQELITPLIKIKGGDVVARLLQCRIFLMSNNLSQQQKGASLLKNLVSESHDPEAAYYLSTLYYNGLYGFAQDKKLALHNLRIAQRGNFPLALLDLAKMYLLGENTEVNPHEAFTLVNRALELDKDLTVAYYLLGDMYINGKGVQKDLKKAYDNFKKAQDDGHVESRFQIARMVSRGEVFELDDAYAAEIYKDLAAQNHIGANYHYGEVLFYGIGINQNVKESVKHLQVAAESGMVEAQYLYAIALDFLGKQEDAIKWFKTVAESEHNLAPEAANRLGEIYQELGELNLSAKYYKKGADAGIEASIVNLARLLYISDKFDEAKVLFESLPNNPVAQVFIGLMHEKGQAYRENEIQALEWYEKSANQGNVDGMYLQALLLLKGKDIPDELRSNSKKLLEHASCLGNADALIYLSEVYYTRYASNNTGVGWLKYGLDDLNIQQAGYILNEKSVNQDFLNSSYTEVKSLCSKIRK